MQEEPAASVDEQPFTTAKGPLAATLEMCRVEPPTLISVTFCDGLELPTAWGANSRVPGDSEREGAVTPLPLNPASRLAPFVPEMLSEPLRGPGATGLKLTLYVQEEPPGTPALGQLETWEKSPEICTEANWKQVVPELVRVSSCDALEVPMS